jgi:poly-gamma-glutamate synthesis protein (capsule biosynthesis protein)
LKKSTKVWLAAAAIVVLLIILFVATWLLIKNKKINKSTGKKTVGVYVDPQLKESSKYFDVINTQLTSKGYEVSKTESPDAEVVVSANGGDGYKTLTESADGEPVKLGSSNLVNLNTSIVSYIKLPEYLSKDYDQIKDSLATSLSNPTTWTLKVAGDIIIGRTVYEQEMKRGDYTSSFLKVKDLLQSADYTIADAEWTAADGISHPLQGLSFSSPSKSLDGLSYAGIDAVSLANNHSMNGGTPAFEQMLNSLTERGIGYFGAGRNYEQAHTPYIADIKGTKVAFLGYTSIPGNVESGTNTTGNAFIKISPWYPFDESSVAQMEADIKSAKTRANVVIPYFHWSEEYTHQPNEQMRNVAHRAIDAGATMVVGSHPHWVQGVEWYKDTLIAYSLGNFVFDQEQSLKTKQGAVLSATFSGNKLTKADLIPIQIEQFYQPHILEGDPAQQVLNNIYSNSYWKN